MNWNFLVGLMVGIWGMLSINFWLKGEYILAILYLGAVQTVLIIALLDTHK